MINATLILASPFRAQLRFPGTIRIMENDLDLVVKRVTAAYGKAGTKPQPGFIECRVESYPGRTLAYLFATGADALRFQGEIGMLGLRAIVAPYDPKEVIVLHSR
ncbi:hypothetical protein [Silvimonas sp.]|uniref:hypothetical protein n=1 Tax=Silvimonas sp. TaxID=2650811 RepID=UPI002850A5B4|nr:hypothetical protein [Silvimonas sp.]MDR3426921.1 hypothetical protein [Silvimonas sp.]